jgi:nitrite reductase/ring-hydroxylating ferredoxin subunit/uncharacterized membrane protein
MDSHKISNWITRQDKLDAVAKPVQEWIGKLYAGDSKGSVRLEQFLHGKWLGHPLHAVLVHVPVGAWTLAALLDLFSSRSGARAAADWAIAAGLIVAIPAMITGATDWYVYGSPSVRRIGFLHMSANLLAFLFYALSYIVRGGDHMVGALITGYTGFAFLIVSGYLGGLMVYEKNVGVNHAQEADGDEASDDFVPVMRLGELLENTPTKVQVGEVSAVLVKTADRVFAMADKCAHEGGPLSEGEIVDNCIVCPWHCSVFRLEDGQVVSGPSVYAQPVFEVYIKDDEIRVKPIRAEDPMIASTPIAKSVSLM